MKNLVVSLTMIFLCTISIYAQNGRILQVASPDGAIVVKVEAGSQLTWSVTHKGEQIITPSAIALQLQSGEVLGADPKISSSKMEKVKRTINAINYKKNVIPDEYNQLTVRLKGDYGLLVRAYNDGVAYRLFTSKKEDLTVKNEVVNFNFTEDHKAFIPFVKDLRGTEIYVNSFESLYKETNISKFNNDTLAFLPLLVDIGDGKKALILEADLEDYPGMFINVNQETRQGLVGEFAPFPLEEKQGGFNMMNLMVTKRADYIAKTKGTRSFPWRAVVISEQDRELLDNDIVQKLASPPRIADVSWIKPGKVAWDWWNNWNISHVDFKAGINTATYKYYIDFAAANKLEYIVMDEGWSVSTDMTKVSPTIDMEEIVTYGKEKGVGVILWATWYALTQQIDDVFEKYSKMGVKGFKIDFLDRDDQKMVASTYEIAEKAARHKLMIDLHGMYKPTGLQRTYPNVIGFEGVKGMENTKWARDDVPRYDVTIPFIRMVAGPMDYTPGAMRNANKTNFRPIHASPMSQGTRCHQLAMYVIFEEPLKMLSDNPTIYMKEQESTDFIAKFPTVYDETVALDGKVGEYVALARRKADTWYVGAMTNWNARELTLDFSFLPKGTYEAEIFKDGVNADREATDYKREVIKISAGNKIKIQLASGGGWAGILRRLN
ncbi:glycoside hydrolase family 97 protein [Chryseolinea sp. H1M3-3]|uniref:glycoside hydrolase family 97 protein n=1 Tax=Chryseolinea sp. H1M3-3 TaxID=3034144 RepID=UPI0023EB837F|nr:glycoside hydrolase family 97 protein [Chryseolinea sp. H1M3-3]